MSSHFKNSFLLQDISIIALSLLVAVILVQSETLHTILNSTKQLDVIGSFVAGMFFTSVFTTAPAIVTLGGIAQNNSIILTAIIGACGAVVGDVIIFRFVRDRLSEHLVELVKHDKWWKRVHALFKFRSFRWMTFMMGGLIIASPFPDELGIGLLGFSKMKLKSFIPVSFLFNFLGILLIGIIARAI